jgi:Spy/CpxP family protein refolding chaperone
MTGRMMVLAAGLALMVVPQATAQEATQEAAQEAKAGHARMSRRAPAGELMFDRAVGRLMDRRYELNLSDDQLARLNDLRGNALSALAPIREEMGSIHEGVSDGSLTREDARTRMKSVREQAAALATDHRDQLGEILEPEQRQMLRNGMARHGSRRGAARHGRPGRMSRRGGDRRP